MTVPVHRMENLAASGSISGSLKVSSAGSPSSSSSSLWRWQKSPHSPHPAPSCSSSWGASEHGRGGRAVPRSGHGSALAAAWQALLGPSPSPWRGLSLSRRGKSECRSTVERGAGQCPLAERAARPGEPSQGPTPRSRQRNEPSVDIDRTGQRPRCSKDSNPRSQSICFPHQIHHGNGSPFGGSS